MRLVDISVESFEEASFCLAFRKESIVVVSEVGDGRIFVIPVLDTVRIRTGERGDIALYNAEKEE